jgi:hypothetical protein
MSQEYHQVHPIDVQQNWGLFEALISKAMTKTQQEEYSLQGCYERLITNQWQLFVIIKDNELESIFVTCVIPFDLCCYLNPMFLAAVDNKKVDLEYMQKCLEETAVKFNCDRIIGGGRKGWKKVLSKFGYKDLNLVVKEL